ncbi:MAG: hypothetical protein ABJD53_04190, partial [Gammaproteobacteria bacterium]
YMRFCQMLLNGDKLDGVRLLGPSTVELDYFLAHAISPSMTHFDCDLLHAIAARRGTTARRQQAFQFHSEPRSASVQL